MSLTAQNEESDRRLNEVFDLERQQARKDKECRQAYREFIDEFEEISALIHERVGEAIAAAMENSSVTLTQPWRDEATELAQELKRQPWLVVSAGCPAAYDTLKLLYIEWAQCCHDLSRRLRDLACDRDYNKPTRVRIYFAHEEFAAVTAHNTARRIYLDGLV
jgi:hypothetical protein